MKQLFFCLMALLLANTAQGQGVFRELSPKEFNDGIEKEPEAVLLDVRTIDELKNDGVIRKAAMQIDYFDKKFEEQIKALDKTKTYYVYCASGVRSGETVELMKKSGFRTAYNLKGGSIAWKKARLPLVPFENH